MDISNLWTLQVMMFFLVAAGAVLKSTGILKDDAKGILTDLVLYFFSAGAAGMLYSQQSSL